MFWVLVIVAIIVILVFKGKTGSGADNHGSIANQSRTDNLISDPYYNEYKLVFDRIRYSDQPQYKIDWLMASLARGRKLEKDGIFVLDSIEKNLPYFCETEYEYDRVRKSLALQGAVDEILSLASMYTNDSLCAHQAKKEYWAGQLVERARRGDYVAQGALCSNLARNIFSQEETSGFHEQYEAGIISAANNNDPNAQFAYGLYFTGSNYGDRLQWLLAAANGGNLTDAWFHAATTYELLRRYSDNGQLRESDLTQEELEALNTKHVHAFLSGAEANNGPRAAECQAFVASCYQDGDYILPKDYDKAEYWYKKAGENGRDVTTDLQVLVQLKNGTF